MRRCGDLSARVRMASGGGPQPSTETSRLTLSGKTPLYSSETLPPSEWPTMVSGCSCFWSIRVAMS